MAKYQVYMNFPSCIVCEVEAESSESAQKIAINSMKNKGISFMNRKERIQRLRENGYPIIHLFGNLYWGRIYSKNYKKFSLWWFHRFKEPVIQIDETPIKPQGEYRLNK